MAGPQDILAQLQALQGGGGMPQPAPQPAGDPAMALKALLGQGAMTGMQPQGVTPSGQNPMAAALALMGDNAGMRGTQAGLGGDADYYDINEANQNVRGNLPKPYNPDMTGFSDDMMPMEERRQTPDPKGGYGTYDDGRNEPPIGLREPNLGQKIAPGGGPMSTEQELGMVQGKMGSSDPSDDGNFPTNKEIIDLQQGKISMEEFDAKWGKGAAKEMMDQDTDDEDDDPAKDNDPTTRRLPIDKQRAKGQANSAEEDDANDPY